MGTTGVSRKEKSHCSKKKDEAKGSSQNETVEVLYQKMGDRWFAFSLVDDEIFVGSISQNELDVSQ